MKNKVSFNIKANKKSDADEMLLHSCDLKSRMKSENVQKPERTKYNVTTKDLHLNYLRATKRVEKIKRKAIQKNANHYLEGLLSFSDDRVLEIGEKSFRAQSPQLIDEYGKRIAKEYGFEYLGFSLHFDEGKTNKETGKFEYNYHAHLSFVNFDFKTNKARFREYQEKYTTKKKAPNRHFVKMQDMAGEVFQKIGFERGVSKEITKRKHLEKEEYVQLAELRAEQDRLRLRIDELKAENSQLERQKTKLQHAMSILEVALTDELGDFAAKIKSWFNKPTSAAACEIANTINNGFVFTDELQASAEKIKQSFKAVEQNSQLPSSVCVSRRLKISPGIKH